RRPEGIAWRGVTLAGALLLSRLLYSTLMAEHVVRLMRTNQFVRSHFYLDYADIGWSLVILFELLLGLAIFRPVLFSGARNEGIASGRLSMNVLIAFAGITLSALVIPFTPRVLQPIVLVQLITDNLFFSQKLLIPALLIILLPPVAEIAFRNLM